MIPDTLRVVPEALATALHQRGYDTLTPVQRGVVDALPRRS